MMYIRNLVDPCTTKLLHDAYFGGKNRILCVLDVLFALESVDFLGKATLNTVDLTKRTVIQLVDYAVPFVDNFEVIA